MLHVHHSPSLVSILSQINPVQMLPSYFILPFHLRSDLRSDLFPSRTPSENFFHHTSHVSPPVPIRFIWSPVQYFVCTTIYDYFHNAASTMLHKCNDYRYSYSYTFMKIWIVCIKRYSNTWFKTCSFTGGWRKSHNLPFKDEAQTALFKDPVRTAL